MFQKNYHQDIGREVEKLASGLSQCFWKYSLLLEKNRFELSNTLMQEIFFNEYIGKNFGDLWQFEHTHICTT